MTDIHDFTNTVVAVLNPKPAIGDAVDQLSAAGYEFEVLRGQEGQEHIDPAGETGVRATVKRLLDAFGDQYRIMERLDQELAAGNTVISVESGSEQSSDAIRILREHGGRYIWRLGAWTFTPIEE